MMPTDAETDANSGRESAFALRIPGYVYEQLADHIAGLIERGKLRPHTPLPAERRLAEEYGVSLGTARRATRVLRKRGLVVTLRSKGTFVTETRSLAVTGEGVGDSQPEPVYGLDLPAVGGHGNGSLARISAGHGGE